MCQADVQNSSCGWLAKPDKFENWLLVIQSTSMYYFVSQNITARYTSAFHAITP